MTTPAPILPVGDFSRVIFQKPSPDVDGGLFYDLAHDPLPDGRAHYVQLGMDYATLGAINGVQARGSYLAIYDNKIDKDFVKYGCVWPWSGSVAFGADAIIPGVQFSVHDFPWIHRSLDIYSQQDGVCLNGRSMASDRLTIQRDDNTVSAWLHFHQGSGIFDWRLGMEPERGSYDLVLFNPDGNQGTIRLSQADSSLIVGPPASNPGQVVLRIKPDGTMVNKTITALEQRITNLEAKIRSIEK